MKIQSSNTKLIYNFEVDKKRTKCPECSHDRRKKDELCVSWDMEAKRGYCHHCLATFFEFEKKQDKVYIIPEWKNETKLNDKTVKYFESRGITQSTLNFMQVYSDKEFMPQYNKEVDVICFPYFRDSKLVNIKYRGPEKSFKLIHDAELILYNIDRMADGVIIVEGEIDALSFVQAGIKNVVSVPNGANKNLEYIDNSFEKFESFKSIILATDNDNKGIELRDELARRFGFEKCSTLSFKECKDANEYLVKYGQLELFEHSKTARPYPVAGIVKVGDIYEDIVNLFNNGIQPGKSIVSDLDKLITWETGRLAIVTGIPGHGKSEFVDWLISRLSLLHGWKLALFTPENYPLKFHYAKIFEKFIGRKFNNKVSEEDFYIAYDYIKDNFFYIMDEEDYSLDLILDAGKSLIRSKGIKVLVIDPYNKIEYQADKHESETQYVSRLLDRLQMFARFNDVLLILVAHPKKMSKDKGVFEVPNLYDISGSAHFFNKADYGITIYRKWDEKASSYMNSIDAYVQKVKFKHLGQTGFVELNYNYNNGRFENDIQDVDHWDNSNWLINEIEEHVI